LLERGRVEMKKRIVLLTIAFSMWQIGQSSRAQSLGNKTEIGAQFTLVRQADTVFFNSPGAPSRWDPGLGGRVGYNFAPYFALEGELDLLPKDDLFNGRKIEGLFGLKGGYRSKTIGVFAKARPGFIHSPQSVTTCLVRTTLGNGSARSEFERCFSAGSRTDVSLDLGGVVELYTSKRSLLRFDVGDTLQRTAEHGIDFNDAGVGVVVLRPSRTAHNLQMSLGVGFRF
jgi:hypothetical protein